MSGPPRFALDGHLGGLARLLRSLGWDAAWQHPRDDLELIVEAREQGRLLLTRDKRLLLHRGLGSHLLLRANSPEEQLKELLRSLRLRPDPADWFTRCLVCNLAVVRIGRDSAAPCVPPYVLAAHSEFRRCPGCGRVYWPGTHGQNMRRRLQQLIEEAEHDPAGQA